MKQRTTVSAEADDLEFLRAEATRLGVSLNDLLSAAVADKAAEIQASKRPRFGIARGGSAQLAEKSVEDEVAPALGRGQG